MFEYTNLVTIKRYSTSPEVVEAAELTESNMEELARWCGGIVQRESKPSDPTDVYNYLVVPHALATFKLSIGQWLVKDLETGRFSRKTAEEMKKFHEVGLRQDGPQIKKTRSGAGSVSTVPKIPEYPPYTINGSGEAAGEYADARYWTAGDTDRDELYSGLTPAQVREGGRELSK